MTTEQKMWGIHMDASVASDPIDNSYVAIGWAELGDLTHIPDTRDDFKAAYQRIYSNAKLGAIPVQAGVLYRFMHEVDVGDYVVYPSKNDRMINIGKISGKYRHDPKRNAEFPNQRPVKWLKHFPREAFSQSALYEVGSIITLFAVRNHQQEFIAALGAETARGSDSAAQSISDDAAITKRAAEQAEETAQDFLIRRLKSGMDAYRFEEFVAQLLRCMGYHARVTPKSGDGGVDVIAHRDELGLEPPIIKVQCKQVVTPIGRPEVTQLLGNTGTGEFCLFVTLGAYSKDARELERSKPNLRLLDGEQLSELVFKHYELIGPGFQAIIPLKRILVPAISAES